MTDKIELTREELKTMLHSATGNVKDFVMDNDNFIEGMIQAMNFSRCSTELKVDKEDNDDWVQDVIDRESMSAEWRKENL